MAIEYPLLLSHYLHRGVAHASFVLYDCGKQNRRGRMVYVVVWQLRQQRTMDNKNRLNLLFENKFMHAALFAVFNLLNLLSL